MQYAPKSPVYAYSDRDGQWRGFLADFSGRNLLPWTPCFCLRNRADRKYPAYPVSQRAVSCVACGGQGNCRANGTHSLNPGRSTSGTPDPN